jgi:3-methylfumaryl-CoA hydratase
VTVEHTIRQLGDVKIVEEHDIVYREAAKLSATAEAVAEPIHLRTSGIRAAGALCTRTSPQSLRVTPSVSALFRYSALTFNTHRIHFDRDYCRHEEHYDGLVFHGPLTATLMANLAQSIEGRALKSFDYRALGPLLDTEIFDIEADSAGSIMSIAAKKTDGQVVMQASATFQAEVSSASPGFC